ncbi:hypothetical protein ERO13_A06G003150v2 [Gossypium hirsutum]|nr:hypothetical protein ERO13_A06G003150v2 [Gossypium hirsutum]
MVIANEWPRRRRSQRPATRRWPLFALTSRRIQGLSFLDPRVRKKMVQSPSFERESDDGEGPPTAGLRISLRCQRSWLWRVGNVCKAVEQVGGDGTKRWQRDGHGARLG